MSLWGEYVDAYATASRWLERWFAPWSWVMGTWRSIRALRREVGRP